MRFLESIYNAILNRSPEELIGALIVAAAVAIALAGGFALRRRKTSPSPTFVGSLALVAGIACMALTAGYIEYAQTDWNSGLGVARASSSMRPPGGPGWPTSPGPWGTYGAGWSSGFHVVVAADEDGDGRLGVDEVTRLVLRADTDGDGLVNFRDIDRVIAGRFRTPSGPSGLTDAGQGVGNRGHEPPDNGRRAGPVLPRGALR
jgi:hypothetical protein